MNDFINIVKEKLDNFLIHSDWSGMVLKCPRSQIVWKGDRGETFYTPRTVLEIHTNLALLPFYKAAGISIVRSSSKI